MEIKIKNGTIKYRLPNYAESWRIRAAVSIVPDGYNATAWTYSKVAENVGDFLDLSDAGCTLDELMGSPEHSSAITEIVSVIASRVVEFFTEKKQISKK